VGPSDVVLQSSPAPISLYSCPPSINSDPDENSCGLTGRL
jgi:hypothetical protein